MSHTPEPWYKNQFNIKSPITVQSNTGEWVCKVSSEGNWAQQSHKTEKANAARIVACVNACAGMDDPAAEIDALKAANQGVLSIPDVSKILHLENLVGIQDTEIAALKADNERVRAMNKHNITAQQEVFAKNAKLRANNQTLVDALEASAKTKLGKEIQDETDPCFFQYGHDRMIEVAREALARVKEGE